MKKLFLIILFIPLLSWGQDRRDSVLLFLNCVKSESLIEGYYSDRETRYLNLGPKLFEELKLNNNAELQQKYESILHKNFTYYKQEIKNLVFAHYFNLSNAQFSKSYELCNQSLELEEMREKSKYFDVMDSANVEMQAWFDHDLPFLVEALMASEAPLSLIVFIGNDSISNAENIDLQLTLVLKDSERVDLLQSHNLEITTPTNLDYENIEYLELRYNGQVYEYFKPIIDASTLSIDPYIIAQVNAASNVLTKDSFEEKLFWYLTVNEKEILLKIKGTETHNIKTNANNK